MSRYPGPCRPYPPGLESRLDNVVFRGGFARTINGKRLDIPGAEVRARDVVALRERSRELDVIATSLVHVDTRLIVELYAQ